MLDSTHAAALVEYRPNDRDFDALRAASAKSVSKSSEQVDLRGLVVCKPWGYEYLLYQGRHSAIWLLHLRPGQATSMHCHVKKTTALIVMDGTIRLHTLSGDIQRLPGEGAWIGWKTFHQSEAGPNGAILFELEAPVDKHDLVRWKDAYGRQRLGYEGPEKTRFMPSGLTTYAPPLSGTGWSHRIGKTTISIHEPAGRSRRVSVGRDLLCVLEGGGVDVEGYLILAPGNCVVSGQIGRRVTNWRPSSLVAAVSTSPDTGS